MNSVHRGTTPERPPPPMNARMPTRHHAQGYTTAWAQVHIIYALHSFAQRGPRFTPTRGDCGGSAVFRPFKGRSSYASATACATGTATRAVSIEGIATADRGFILNSTAPANPQATSCELRAASCELRAASCEPWATGHGPRA